MISEPNYVFALWVIEIDSFMAKLAQTENVTGKHRRT